MDQKFATLTRTAITLEAADPTQEESDQLCLHIRAFEDRFTIKQIVKEFIEARRNKSLNERDVVKQVAKKFHSYDPKIDRARTFILHVLQKVRTEDQALRIQSDLEAMSKLAEENIRKGYLDFERLKKENDVNGDIKALRKLSAEYLNEQKMKELNPKWKSKRKVIQPKEEPDVVEIMGLIDHVDS